MGYGGDIVATGTGGMENACQAWRGEPDSFVQRFAEEEKPKKIHARWIIMISS